jgi:putative aldouronate transport system substrate-binding protein
MTQISRRSLLFNGGKALLAAGTLGTAGSLIAACSSSDDDSASGPVNLKYQYFSYVDAPDVPLVQQAMNDYLKKLGKSFTITLQPTMNYDQKMTLNMSAGDVGDLFFTATWSNDFYKNAGSGNLFDITTLLPQHAPKLYASLPESIWAGAKVKGKIYGVINQQRFPKLWGFIARKDLAEKYGLDPAAITTYADVEPFLAKVKAGEKGVIGWATDNGTTGTAFYPELHGFDPVATAYGLAVRYDDPQRRVFNVYATPEFKAAAQLLYRWRGLGYTTTDPQSSEDRATKQHSGGIALWANQAPPTNPQLETFATVSKSLVPTPILNTDGCASTLTGVSADTKHPAQALEFLELLNTDKYFYNLLCFGIEGKHYVLDRATGVASLPAGMDPAKSPYNPNADWQFGDQFNAYYRTKEDAAAKRWDVESALNKSAAVSTALGFSLDTSQLRTEVATVAATIKQYQQQIAIGLVDPDKGIPEFLDKLNKSGMPTLLSKAQEQMDAFGASAK